MSDDVLPALLHQVGALDEREGEHFAQFTESLRQVRRAMAAVSTEGHMHREALAAMEGLAETVADLDARVRILAGRHHDEESKTYQPTDNVGWHKLEGEELDKAVARLRSWAERVFIPGYGHLSRQLPPCWDKHPICWYVLDWLSELWSILYLTEKRSAGALAGQAEFTVRILPSAVEQMAAEAKGCNHGPQRRP
jgi:hypothetical protein